MYRSIPCMGSVIGPTPSRFQISSVVSPGQLEALSNSRSSILATAVDSLDSIQRVCEIDLIANRISRMNCDHYVNHARRLAGDDERVAVFRVLQSESGRQRLGYSDTESVIVPVPPVTALTVWE